MMAWKLATSPTTAASASAPAAFEPKMARKPSRIGSPEVPSANAPWTVVATPAASVTCARSGSPG